jgi:hypothetical protein
MIGPPAGSLHIQAITTTVNDNDLLSANPNTLINFSSRRCRTRSKSERTQPARTLRSPPDYGECLLVIFFSTLRRQLIDFSARRPCRPRSAVSGNPRGSRILGHDQDQIVQAAMNGTKANCRNHNLISQLPIYLNGIAAVADHPISTQRDHQRQPAGADR